MLLALRMNGLDLVGVEMDIYTYIYICSCIEFGRLGCAWFI